MESVPLELARWRLGAEEASETEHLGRRCLAFAEGFLIAPLPGVELTDGAVELDLCLTRNRAFHGVVWRLADGDNHEAFFVRPHQVGNPDAIQYTPVFNGVSGWQLYHGEGYGAPIRFPVDEWFTIRVAFAGARGEVFVGDLEAPALVIGDLKRGVAPGQVGIQVGGPGLHVAAFRHEAGPIAFRAPAPPPVAMPAGTVPAWWVSDPFSEDAVRDGAPLDLAARSWTRLDVEASGLANLARVNGLTDEHNTVLARATIVSAHAQTKALALGFSDRAVSYLNGTPLFRGDDSYRSRDYRFLGSIGYFDTLFLPLRQGENELVVAVSESFGGWGIQARFLHPAGVSFEP